MLPPLTLQLLVENVIKHNTITQNKPMMINLYIDNGELVVSNNIREKQNQTTSKTGLKNLSNRCKLILGKDIKIDKSNDLFIVKVPLIYE